MKTNTLWSIITFFLTFFGVGSIFYLGGIDFTTRNAYLGFAYFITILTSGMISGAVFILLPNKE